MLRKILVLLMSFYLGSCSAVSISKKTSPVVYFSNASGENLTNIRVIWGNENILSLSNLKPGDTRSQSFEIASSSDFFGLVRISWTNGKGEGVSREFFFRKNNLPSMDDDSTYNYVQIYLEQNNFEVMTSDAADLESKTKRRDAMLKFYSQKAGTTSTDHIPTSLIRVENLNDRSEPAWLSRYY